MATHDIGVNTDRWLPTQAAGEVVVRHQSIADYLDVDRALATPTRIVLDVELHFLTFGQGVEQALGQSGSVHEDLAAVLGAYETKATITEESDDGSSGHGVHLTAKREHICAFTLGRVALGAVLPD